MYGRSFIFGPNKMGWEEFVGGMSYSVPFLLILTVHEFGHYILARINKVEVSLPYYLPMWFGFMGMPSLGTMGAVIRMKGKVHSKRQHFDIGVAGPVAGFVVALAVLFYGFTNLPEKQYILDIHPEYEVFGEDYEDFVYESDTFVLNEQLAAINAEAASYQGDTIFFNRGLSILLGGNLLFDFFENNVIPDDEKHLMPNEHEIMHYPWLLAGYLALFFTALNLLPIGQLDGGHVVYGLFGRAKARIVSVSFFIGFLFYSGLGSGLGFINPFDYSLPMSELLIQVVLYIALLYFVMKSVTKVVTTRIIIALSIAAGQYLVMQFYPSVEGYAGWMLFAIILGRLVGVEHPPALNEEPLDTNRQILGWLALVIFVISLSPQPLIFVIN